MELTRIDALQNLGAGAGSAFARAAGLFAGTTACSALDDPQLMCCVLAVAACNTLVSLQGQLPSRSCRALQVMVKIWCEYGHSVQCEGRV